MRIILLETLHFATRHPIAGMIGSQTSGFEGRLSILRSSPIHMVSVGLDHVAVLSSFLVIPPCASMVQKSFIATRIIALQGISVPIEFL